MEKFADYLLAVETSLISFQATGKDIESTKESNGKDKTNSKGVTGDKREEWDDHEDDHVLNPPHCGKQMKMLYENRWHTRKINYFSKIITSTSTTDT